MSSITPLPTPLVEARQCRGCGRNRDAESPDKGAYAKLCKECCSERARARQLRNTNQPKSRIDLAAIVHKAEDPASRFQAAIEQRHAAKLEAQAALLAFNQALREIQDAARLMMNGHEGPHSRVEQELEARRSSRDEE